jgi:hypothetical protein
VAFRSAIASMTQITTTTTFLANSHLFGGQSQGGFQAYHLAQPSFPVWGVVLAVAVTVLALAGVVILRLRQRA